MYHGYNHFFEPLPKKRANFGTTTNKNSVYLIVLCGEPFSKQIRISHDSGGGRRESFRMLPLDARDGGRRCTPRAVAPHCGLRACSIAEASSGGEAQTRTNAATGRPSRRAISSNGNPGGCTAPFVNTIGISRRDASNVNRRALPPGSRSSAMTASSMITSGAVLRVACWANDADGTASTS